MNSTERRTSKESQDRRAGRRSRQSKDANPSTTGKKAGFARDTKDDKRKALPPKPVNLNRRMSRMSKESAKQLSSWAVKDKWAPERKLSDEELQRCRTMFYQLDADGSGSIDVEELGVAMRQLGQSPTEQELRELIFSVDEGDLDGKLQFREFAKLFALGIDTEGEAKLSDATDCFCAHGGEARDDASRVDAVALHDNLLRDFGLDVDLNDTFGMQAQELTKHDMERLVLKTREGGRGDAPRQVSYR